MDTQDPPITRFVCRESATNAHPNTLAIYLEPSGVFCSVLTADARVSDAAPAHRMQREESDGTKTYVAVTLACQHLPSFEAQENYPCGPKSSQKIMNEAQESCPEEV
jgi:hypothetical protein